MSKRKYDLHDGKSGAAITVRVVPRSSQNEISEVLDDGTIKIRQLPAVTDEAANKNLLAFLAQVLEVNPKQLEIVAGISGNDKLITILDLDKELVQERILRHLA
jgi:uncharacterized protein YggU (UPF0235/DUF167 family)